MGLPGRNHIYRFGRTLAPEAIYPQPVFMEDGEAVQYNWGPSEEADSLIEDANGVFRAMKLCTAEEGLVLGEQQADVQEEAEGDAAEGDEAEALEKPGVQMNEEADCYQFGTGFVRPSHAANFFIKRYVEFYCERPSLKAIRFVMDYIGCTPKNKTITRTGPSQKAVVWTKNQEELFSSDQRFRNTVHEYFADGKAKRLWYRYMTHELVTRLPLDPGFPEHALFVLYGAVWGDSDGCVIEVGKHHVNHVKTWCPRAEADLVIRWILNEYRSSSNQLLISADSDFFPILLDVVKQKYAEDGPQARHKYNIYWRSGVTYNVQITKEDYMRTLLPAGAPINPFDKVKYDEMVGKWQGFLLENTPPPKKSPPAEPKRAAKPKECITVRMRRAIQIISMNEMFEAVWCRMYLASERCDKCCPIQTFALLCFLAGSDYLPQLGYITFELMMRVYLSGFHQLGGCICPFSQKLQVRVNSQALYKLVCQSYRLLHSKVLTVPLVPQDDLELFRKALIETQTKAYETARDKAIQEQLAQDIPLERMPAGKPLKINYGRMPPEQGISSWMAAAHWTVNYYLYMLSNEQMPCLDPFICNGEGLPVHGYIYTNDRASLAPCAPVPLLF
jgi:hypothetical protein